MLQDDRDLPKQPHRAQFREGGREADRRRTGKKTLNNGWVYLSLADTLRLCDNTERWRKLAVKSSVVSGLDDLPILDRLHNYIANYISRIYYE